MNSYAIIFVTRVEKSLATFPEEVQRRLLERLEKLSRNPFPPGVKKLKDRDGYRVRVGNYRIIYDVDTKGYVIVVTVIAHRKDAYA